MITVDGEAQGKAGIHKSLVPALYFFAHTAVVVLTRLGQDKETIPLFLHLPFHPLKTKGEKIRHREKAFLK